LLLNNYAATLRQLGRLDEAADYAERAYAKGVKTEDQDTIYHALNTRALIYIDLHDYKRAADMLAELQPMVLRIFPPGHYWLGAFASVQALLASGTGDSKTAQLLANRSVEIVDAASKAGKAGSDFLPIALLRRGQVELAAGQPEKAANDAHRALSLLKSASRPDDFSCGVGNTYLTLGRALEAQGKANEARAAFHSAADHFQNTLGANDAQTRNALQLEAANAR
jgi:tetratricopeptide (TPR) repeat protein